MISASGASAIPYAKDLADRSVYQALAGGLTLLPAAFPDNMDGRSTAFDLKSLPVMHVHHSGGTSVTPVSSAVYNLLSKEAAAMGLTGVLPSLGARCEEKSRMGSGEKTVADVSPPVVAAVPPSQPAASEPPVKAIPAWEPPDMEELLQQEPDITQTGQSLAAEIAAARQRSDQLLASFSPPAGEPVKPVEREPVSAPKVAAPRWTVVFSAPFGQVQARYHEVTFGSDCVVLCYDTAFENGFQYLPPNMGTAVLQVHIPHKRKEPYNCHSLGLAFRLGRLDCVLLLLSSDEVKES